MAEKVSRKIKRAPGMRCRERLPVPPIARLKRTLNVFEFTSADEIMAAFRIAHGQPVTRDADLDIPASIRADAADDRAARRTDLTTAYPQWRRDLSGSLPLQVAEAVLISETPLSEIDARRRWRKGTARKHFAVALRHFAYLRHNTPRNAGKDWKYSPEKDIEK